jgi:hypothetical protein
MKHSILTTTLWVVVTYDVFFLVVKELIATHPTHRNFDEIDFIRITTYDVLPVATCTCEALQRFVKSGAGPFWRTATISVLEHRVPMIKKMAMSWNPPPHPHLP